MERTKWMKKEMKIRRMVSMVAAILLLAVSAAYAEDNRADNMQVLAEKIRADKKLIVASNMGLTETEAKAFWPVYQAYQDELFLLRQRTIAMINDYAGAFQAMTDSTAKKLLEEYLTIESLGLKLRQEYLPKFKAVLPDIKVMRYYQIENKIEAGWMYELAEKIPLTEDAKD
jgi:hypothetical protein